MKNPKYILPIIVFSQFCCTSLWFAGNGVMNDLVFNFNIDSTAVGHLTSSLQFGFIVGTLIFAVLSIADRFSPSKVFLFSALIAAIANLAVIWEGNTFLSLLTFRFITGFFLAGIYPVGMKIAADYYQKGLGISLSFLVGALVVGTAFPHLIKNLTNFSSWKLVLVITSSIAVIGGVLIRAFVPDGPFRKTSQNLEFSAFFKVFKSQNFRSAAFGYFGHMWELYAFWAFVPIILKTYNTLHNDTSLNISLWSFIVIAVGGFACVIGGYLSKKTGVKRIAFISLLLSCICCLASPLVFMIGHESLFLGFLILWGMFVIADSPLLSTLVADNVKAEIKGTALTIVNSIGFAISIVSIQILTLLSALTTDNSIYVILGIGPVLGLWTLRKKETQNNSTI